MTAQNALVEALLQGDKRALARLLTAVENGHAGVMEMVAPVFPHTGNAQVIGITGAPGTGKSTLVTELAKAYRAMGKTVGILAVDPTSPYTGGALQGDRIRMRDLSGDSGVFIRSMATRGALGGLARGVLDAIRLMDAAGMSVVLVETVGAGQSEVDIVRAAQTTLVVEAPGMGDDVQAIKAGILEIADVLVVNKADRPGVENTVRGLRAMLELGHPVSREERHHGRIATTGQGGATASQDDEPPVTSEGEAAIWIPPIVQTVASEGQGLEALITAISAHQEHLATTGAGTQLTRAQLSREFKERLSGALVEQFLSTLPADTLRTLVDQMQTRTLTPQQAVTQLLIDTNKTQRRHGESRI